MKKKIKMKNPFEEYTEEKKPLTDEEKEFLYKRGKYAGATLAGLGAIQTGMAIGSSKNKAWAEEIEKRGLEEGRKILKIAGPASIAAGSAVAGVSAYKHYKHKKKKGEGDDSSKN